MTRTSVIKQKDATTEAFGARIPFDDLHTPGAYVCDWSGHLLRVPADAITEAKTPQIEMIGRHTLTLTKISNNPYIALNQARTIAADHDVNVNF